MVAMLQCCFLGCLFHTGVFVWSLYFQAVYLIQTGCGMSKGCGDGFVRIINNRSLISLRERDLKTGKHTTTGCDMMLDNFMRCSVINSHSVIVTQHIKQPTLTCLASGKNHQWGMKLFNNFCPRMLFYCRKITACKKKLKIFTNCLRFEFW